MDRRPRPTKGWWKAYDALYGKGEPRQLELGAAKTAPKSKAKPRVDCPTEQNEQFVLAAWLRKNNIPFHHSPNGGRRDYLEAVKFKRLGTSAGFPDIFIPISRKSSHGLFLELKRVSGGRLSDSQLIWRDLLLREGYAWYEAKGAQEAIKIVEDYLKC